MSAVTAWMDDAACTTTDPEAFVPNVGANNRTARRICNNCPVAGPCLEWAITAKADGIYAGTTTRQRATIRAERAAA